MNQPENNHGDFIELKPPFVDYCLNTTHYPSIVNICWLFTMFWYDFDIDQNTN